MLQTRGSKASLQSEDAGFEALVSASLQSRDAGLEAHVSAKLKARVSDVKLDTKFEARISNTTVALKREAQDPRPAVPQWLNAELKSAFQLERSFVSQL